MGCTAMFNSPLRRRHIGRLMRVGCALTKGGAEGVGQVRQVYESALSWRLSKQLIHRCMH
ncbi:hypothetical protein XAB3213_3830012 [Xanthomonas citri pv. bilvae]|nr:hypothetical protein XAB3213_3830012 [Xanthomonas citri pv. bilvae]